MGYTVFPIKKEYSSDSYTAPFWGRDVLAQDTAIPPTLLFNHNHDIALYRNKKLVVFGLNNNVNTFHYQLGASTFKPVANEPDLTDLATA